VAPDRAFVDDSRTYGQVLGQSSDSDRNNGLTLALSIVGVIGFHLTRDVDARVALVSLVIAS
jgi:hypothetical protein